MSRSLTARGTRNMGPQYSAAALNLGATSARKAPHFVLDDRLVQEHNKVDFVPHFRLASIKMTQVKKTCDLLSPQVL